jgi:hypothetical protein
MQKRREAALAQALVKWEAAVESVEWPEPTPTEDVRILKELIHLQSLVMRAPVAIKESRHLKATSAGVAVTVGGPRPMTPEFFAEVLRILQKPGATEPADDPDVGGDVSPRL